MSDLSFQRGEILTAAKLNLLVQAVTSGSPPAAVGNGNVSPAQPHQVRQREFSSYVPVRRPVYIDETSPHWPLANGTPGWYWRESAGSALTPFPLNLNEGDAVYLKTDLTPAGVVEQQTPQKQLSPNVAWDPYQNKNGVICEQLGVVAAEPYKTGTKATTMQFFEAPASPALPVLVASPPSSPAPCRGIPSFMPPATYLERASLLGPRLGNTQLIKTINTDGGLIFKKFYNSYSGSHAEGVELIPRLAILPAPSTAPPGTPNIGAQLAPGSWHEMAAVDIAGQRLALNMAWVKPWMAYINMSVSGGSGLSGETLHQTWQKTWGKPTIDSPPSPYLLDSGSWRVVSKFGPYASDYLPPTEPDCSFLGLVEEMILQAKGTYASGTNETGDTILQPVLFQAYLRREIAPQTSCWYVWYDDCWTQIPWI